MASRSVQLPLTVLSSAVVLTTITVAWAGRAVPARRTRLRPKTPARPSRTPEKRNGESWRPLRSKRPTVGRVDMPKRIEIIDLEPKDAIPMFPEPLSWVYRFLLYQPVGTIKVLRIRSWLTLSQVTGKRSTTVGRQRGEGKARLLDAGLQVFRAKGYAATTVDDLAAQPMSPRARSLLLQDQGRSQAGSRRLLGREGRSCIRFCALSTTDRSRRAGAGLHRFPALAVVGRSGRLHVSAGHTGAGDVRPPSAHSGRLRSTHQRPSWALLAADIAAAMQSRDIQADWSAESLALFTQSVLQGAFVLAKASRGPQVAIDLVDHLRRYLELLFTKGDGL